MSSLGCKMPVAMDMIPEFSVHWDETHRFGNYSTLGSLDTISQAGPSSLHFVVRFFFSSVVWVVFKLVFQRLHLRTLPLPPGPSAWEFMFHVYVLRRSPAVVLHNLVKLYGPIMHVRAWSQDLLVLSSVAAVEEFYKLHDAEFGARPSSMGRPTLSNILSSVCFPSLATYWNHLHLVLDMTTVEPFEDGSTSGIEWALEALHRHPDVVQHLCAELGRNLECNKPVRESDIAKLPYLRAVVSELLRLHPPCDVSLPHESSHDYCRIFGFELHPHSQVLINIYAVHRDPVMWVNPDNFDPARFLSSHPEDDVMSQGLAQFRFIPFGAGRQQCLGTNLAIQHVQLSLARYYFHQILVDKTLDQNRLQIGRVSTQ